jgi:starch synthase (maltosyl-transferring)
MAAPKQSAKHKPAASKSAGKADSKADSKSASKVAPKSAQNAAPESSSKNSPKSTPKSASKPAQKADVKTAAPVLPIAETAITHPAPLSAAAKAALRAKSKVPDAQAVHVEIENLQPVVDGGRFPAKAVPGEIIEVTADVFRGGHEKCEAALLFRKVGEEKWKRTPMAFVDNDSWSGKFAAYEAGNYEFTVEARTLGHSHTDDVPYRDTPYRYHPPAALRVDSGLTEFSAWYEMWARSQGTDPNKSASFRDMTNRLAEIKDLGFDVIYLPPIHPIGVTKRKGANNSLTAKPGEPGCPYAIGNSHGGHKAVDPELGTLEECRAFFRTAKEMGFAIALDYALNCSPDHPYVKAHPDWFYREKDGTIKCAENPPKKYEDVYPLNFFCADYKNQWKELKSIMEFWIDMGVTIFRVDNPHTKPFVFWEWMIRELKAENPELAFLSEAFTRPKVMKRLAKIGFDMSYTYFTWRTNAAEIREYLEELTQGPEADFMKPIFFPTTPDILPWHLQNAPREMFKIRFALACTLVGAYGMYNSYEICEGAPVPGKEEFTFSEKYQYKVWDWDRPGNIKGFIKTLNGIRRDNRALHQLKNLRFHDSSNPSILVYSKAVDENILLFVVNLDPYNRQGATVTLDLPALGLAAENIYGLYDLLSHESYVWSGKYNYVELLPQKEVMHIFKIEKF